MTNLTPAKSRFSYAHKPSPSVQNVAALFALLAVTACFPTRGQARVAPNPGGPVVVTNSTSATITYSNTAVIDTVDDYSTTLLALVNGSQVYSMTFLAPYGDPTVAAAIASADGILTGDGASFGSPSLLSSSSVLQSSNVTLPSESYTCETVPFSDATGTATVTTTDTFGPATITVGDCNSDLFTILSGQLDINVNTDLQYTVPVETVTTDTYLDSQTYEIAGTETVSSGATPEPASVELVLTGLGAIAWWRRRVISSQG